MNVLIVDDELIELEQLIFLLKKKFPEWNIWEAEDAVQAKKIANTHSLQLALLDIHLPGEDGLTLAYWLKEQELLNNFIFITAHDEFEYAKQAIKLHAFDFILKPIVEHDFYHIIRQFLEKHHIHETESSIVNHILDYIREHFHEKLTLKDVAASVHMSPTYLSRKFSEEMNMGFNDYIQNVRIEQAKQLMIHYPEKTMGSIAEEIGYATQNHFNYQFKKVTGLTPRQYRRR